VSRTKHSLHSAADAGFAGVGTLRLIDRRKAESIGERSIEVVMLRRQPQRTSIDEVERTGIDRRPPACKSA
jgi:hypothetical protein